MLIECRFAKYYLRNNDNRISLRCTLLATAILLILAGCATLRHGTTQSIGFVSTPSGAQVMIDRHVYGVTPLRVTLKRKEDHIVIIMLDGYKPYEITLTRKIYTHGAATLISGTLGTIDVANGAIYTLTPDLVNAVLIKEGAEGDK